MSAEVMSYRGPTGFTAPQYAICLKGIVWREGLRATHIKRNENYQHGSPGADDLTVIDGDTPGSNAPALA